MEHHKIHIFFLFTIVPFIALSQETTDVEFKTINLPVQSETINGMVQDVHGFVWLGTTQSGLFRFDGDQFVQYKNIGQNTNGLISNTISCLATDKNGLIWIGTLGNGLDAFNPENEEFTHFQHNDSDTSSLRSNSITALTTDERGNLWIGTQSGLDRMDIASNKIHHTHTNNPKEQILDQLLINKIFVDRSGVIWVGCGSPFRNTNKPGMGGLFKIDLLKEEVAHYIGSEQENCLSSDEVTSMLEDSFGNFWVGTSGDGLHTMDRKTGKFTRHQYDPKNPNKLSRPPVRTEFNFVKDFISFIEEDHQGNIWIGTMQNGLTRYNPNNKRLTRYGSVASSVSTSKVPKYWSHLKTDDGLFWLGSWMLDAPTISLQTLNTSSRNFPYINLNHLAWAFTEDDKKNIYIGTFGNHIYKRSPGGAHSEIYIPGLDTTKEQNPVRSLSIDANFNLWIGTYQGLCRYNLKSSETKWYSHQPGNLYSLSDNTIRTVFTLHPDTILIGTLSGGLNMLNVKDEKFSHIKFDSIYSTDQEVIRINEIFRDSKNRIWIASGNAGLFQLIPQTKSLKRFSSPAQIFSIYEDTNNAVWFGTAAAGFGFYNEATGSYQTDRALYELLSSSLTVWGIGASKLNSLWLNTSEGYFDYNIQDRTATKYGLSWGINAINGSNQVFNSSSDEIFIGAHQGYYVFRREGLERKKTTDTKPFISGIFIGKEKLKPGSSRLPKSIFNTKDIKLKHNENNVAIGYGWNNFLINTAERQIFYMLEGIEDDWNLGNRQSTATYYNLSPGDYTFKVKAYNMSGKWEETSLRLSITPPWYKTWLAYSLFIIVFIASVRGYITYRGKKLTDEKRILEKSVQERTQELELSIQNLKATQSQLIQSEKMASLGELTAGIAHEIQNPLNFVNNFSEMNKELLAEMEEAVKKGDLEEAVALAKDISANQEKINHHGKRAEGIVKGMLQHSRGSRGQKELTDLNDLCDEYLRLSYHGYRAKDKSFNAKFETEFDALLPRIKIVPQDIGRVVLNLINNAFYAVNEKSKLQTTDYKPQVTVSTKNLGDKIQIIVKDNGNGIPDNIKEKIFQPFFTTKPTGQGTGLGLSLSYDIIKVHGGEIKAESNNNEGTRFTILLPLNNNV